MASPTALANPARKSDGIKISRADQIDENETGTRKMRTLSEGTSGDLDSGGDTNLGVARGDGVELAELPNQNQARSALPFGIFQARPRRHTERQSTSATGGFIPSPHIG